MEKIEKKRVVVFAYHNVGVRCLMVLLNHNVEVALVVTHTDNPSENIWFESVFNLAKLNKIEVITPVDPNTEEVVNLIKTKNPDFIFSFYYRHMLKLSILNLAKFGAYNMHGSLLPKYRGRVPVNWAIIKGETETGATLHLMNEKPDNGAIVDQQAVPILIDDTAMDVFTKVTVAAEITLNRVLPKLLKNEAKLIPQNLKLGAYFGGRTADDGKIIFKNSRALDIHNLVRAVTTPYPGAFFFIQGKKVVVFKTKIENDFKSEFKTPTLFKIKDEIYLIAADQKVLRIIDIEINGTKKFNLKQEFNSEVISLLD